MMSHGAKNPDEAAFVKSRFGKEITVQYQKSLPFTGILKRYMGLRTGTPSLLIERGDGAMIWIDLNPPESSIYMGQV